MCIDIKHIDNKKNKIENTSKVDKIEIRYKNENLITYKRINTNYKYIASSKFPGFIEPRERKKHLEEFIKEQDFFSSPKGYADYKLEIDDNNLLINSSFDNYKNLLIGNKYRLNKIKKILSFYEIIYHQIIFKN